MSMKPWPRKPELIYADNTCSPELNVKTIQWERARADAAMARLRVAVEALMRIRDHTIDEDDIAAIALQQIGELPE